MAAVHVIGFAERARENQKHRNVDKLAVTGNCDTCNGRYKSPWGSKGLVDEKFSRVHIAYAVLYTTAATQHSHTQYSLYMEKWALTSFPHRKT